MKKPLPEKQARTLGSIRGDSIYSLRQFGRELDLHDKCLSDAQKAGMRTIIFGRQKFVLGSDAIDFFQRLAQQQGKHDANSTSGAPQKLGRARF